MIKGFAISTLLLFAAGCAVKMTKKAHSVMEVKAKKSCKVLGIVEGSGSWQGTPAKDREAALKEVRNLTVKRGGDAFRIIAEPDDLSAAYVRAEVLRCNKPKPAKLSHLGESCTRSADCGGKLRCIKQTCVDPNAPPASQPTSQPASQPASQPVTN